MRTSAVDNFVDSNTDIAARTENEVTRTVQWRREPVSVVAADGSVTTRTRYTVPDFSTGQLSGPGLQPGQQAFFFEADLTRVDDWRAFTSNPREDTLANNLLREHIAALSETERLALPDTVQKWFFEPPQRPEPPNPGGYTWHHDTRTGIHQLVDQRLHRSASKGFEHTGGNQSHGSGAVRQLDSVLPADPQEELPEP